MSTDEPTPETPESVRGVRKSAAVRLHPVADPDAWLNATLPEPVPAGSDPAAATAESEDRTPTDDEAAVPCRDEPDGSR